MDLLTFIANIISSIVWPMVVISIAWMIHTPVSILLVALKDRDIEIRFREWCISFKNRLTELSQYLDSGKSEDIKLAQKEIDKLLKQMEDDSKLYSDILKQSYVDGLKSFKSN